MSDLARLHVFAARFNPIRWAAPERHYRDWAAHILGSGADLTVVEVQSGDRPFTADLPGVNHIGLRTDSWAWTKENALNEGVRRTPGAELIAWGDADVFFEKTGWVDETRHALQHYRILQPWTQAIDEGPGGNILQVHRSFCDCAMAGDPVVPDGKGFWKLDGGPYDYPHSGYFWAARREFFDWTGGLLEEAAMGSGDHHMALALVGQVERSWPGGTSESYKNRLLRWQDRARRYVNGRIGVVHGVLRHRFHGAKGNRGYLDRWGMFVRHGFDPDTDLKRNSHGVLEFAGNKPELEREWDAYLRRRREDDNCT